MLFTKRVYPFSEKVARFPINDYLYIFKLNERFYNPHLRPARTRPSLFPEQHATRSKRTTEEMDFARQTVAFQSCRVRILSRAETIDTKAGSPHRGAFRPAVIGGLLFPFRE